MTRLWSLLTLNKHPWTVTGHQGYKYNAVLQLAKLLLESESRLEILSSPYPSWQLHQKAYFRLDQVVLQYPHDQWSSVMIPGLLIIGYRLLSSLAHQQEVVHAGRNAAIYDFYFPVLIVPVLVLYLRLSTKVSKSTLPVTLLFS